MIPTGIENITGNEILITIAVILIALEAINLIGKAIETVKAWKKPGADTNSRIALMEQHLDADKRHLDRIDKENAETKEAIKVIICGVNALLEHELHNGNADQMQEASNNLKNWLINR